MADDRVGAGGERGQILLDEIVEAPVIAPRDRRHALAVPAEVRDRRLAAERVHEAVVAARAEVAPVRHHRVQAQHARTRADPIEPQRDAVRSSNGRLHRD